MMSASIPAAVSKAAVAGFVWKNVRPSSMETKIPKNMLIRKGDLTICLIWSFRLILFLPVWLQPTLSKNVASTMKMNNRLPISRMANLYRCSAPKVEMKSG